MRAAHAQTVMRDATVAIRHGATIHSGVSAHPTRNVRTTRLSVGTTRQWVRGASTRKLVVHAGIGRLTHWTHPASTTRVMIHMAPGAIPLTMHAQFSAIMRPNCIVMIQLIIPNRIHALLRVKVAHAWRERSNVKINIPSIAEMQLWGHVQSIATSKPKSSVRTNSENK